jgi:hypothetical protein
MTSTTTHRQEPRGGVVACGANYALLEYKAACGIQGFRGVVTPEEQPCDAPTWTPCAQGPPTDDQPEGSPKPIGLDMFAQVIEPQRGTYMSTRSHGTPRFPW